MGVWWRMLKPKQAVPIASHFTPWRPADFGPLEHLCGVGCDRAHPILNKGAPSHLSTLNELKYRERHGEVVVLGHGDSGGQLLRVRRHRLRLRLLSVSLSSLVPPPKPFRFPGTPSSIYSMRGDRFGSLPSLLFRGARDRISASRALDAVAVVGIDFALPLLQVQRGKHMGFSRYLLLVPSACCSLPPLPFSLCSRHVCPVARVLIT